MRMERVVAALTGENGAGVHETASSDEKAAAPDGAGPREGHNHVA